MEIETGFVDVCVAGGAESMTNIPYMLCNARNGYRMGDGKLEDGLFTALSDPFHSTHMGYGAIRYNCRPLDSGDRWQREIMWQPWSQVIVMERV